MTVLSEEIKAYQSLNTLADSYGVVIFGGKADRELPLCELRQAFSLEDKLYNRSFDGLSVSDAGELFDACVAPLQPETLLLHIGESDAPLFAKQPADFDAAYRALIAKARKVNPSCRIAVLSVHDNEMNARLKCLAESERCVFFDLSAKRVWNPQETRDVLAFIRPLPVRQPLYDLVKILFCR